MSRFRTLAVAGVMVASFATVGTPAAFADTPTPTPTHTIRPPVATPQTCDRAGRPITFAPTVSPDDKVSPAPVVNPQRRCSPERFVVQITALGSTVVQNRVIASGPVFGTGSDDLSLQAPTRDVFDLPGFFRTVNADHTGIAFPSVDLRLCVATVSQLGLWRFNGGTGLFRHAAGAGTFLLTGQWVFPAFRGVCSLAFIRGNPLLQNRITPRYTSIQVWATGLARR
jgi:hypothetical protein